MGPVGGTCQASPHVYVSRNPWSLHLLRPKTEWQQPPNGLHPHSALPGSLASLGWLLRIVGGDEQDRHIQLTEFTQDLTADATGRDRSQDVAIGGGDVCAGERRVKVTCVRGGMPIPRDGDSDEASLALTLHREDRVSDRTEEKDAL